MRAPAYLKIRSDGDVIRAYIAMTDGSLQVEIATLLRSIAEDDAQSYEIWKEALTTIFKRNLERVTGHNVVSMTEIKPSSYN